MFAFVLVLDAIEMLFAYSVPALLTLAQVESSLDSVTAMEGAGVLGEAQVTGGITDAAGGVLLVSERMITEDLVGCGAL